MRIARLCALSCWICISLVYSVHGEEAPATVSFTLDFPGANPSHYEIIIGSDGHGSYISDGKIDEQSDAMESGSTNFLVSDGVRLRVFNLAKRAHYFSGKVDSGRKNIANTGAKTLAYKDGSHNSHATYNYSLLQPVEELTALFQSLSTTLEFGRRLGYFHKYEKLALDDQLKKMEEMQRGNTLVDLSTIVPVLKEIASDSSVMNVSRARALRLLETGSRH